MVFIKCLLISQAQKMMQIVASPVFHQQKPFGPAGVAR